MILKVWHRHQEFKMILYILIVKIDSINYYQALKQINECFIIIVKRGLNISKIINLNLKLFSLTNKINRNVFTLF